METKHTKGNWKAYKPEVSNGYWCVDNEETSNGTLATCYTLEEAEANAKLIAAAPDMLKALRTLKSHHPDIYIQIPDYLRIECDKAIKKATE